MDPVTGVVVLTLLGGAFGGINALWQEHKERAAAKRRSTRDARNILEERLAKGEIGEEEFTRRMSLLTYGPPLVLDPPSARED